MAKKITKKINSGFTPTVIGNLPIYAYGGRMKYYNGSYLPSIEGSVTSPQLQAQLDTSTLEPMDIGSSTKGGPSMGAISALGNVAGDTIEQAGQVLNPGKPNWGANIGGGAAKGAATGAMFGPWGAAIGGVVGGASGALKSIGQKKQLDAEQEAAIQQRNQLMASNLPGQHEYKPTFADGGNASDNRPKRGLTGWARDVSHKMGVPMAPNQLLYDLKGRQGAINEKSLTKEELNILKNITRKNLAKGKKVIEYNDYGTGTQYGDVSPNSGNKDILEKTFDPSYNMKTTFGQMGIHTANGDTTLYDRYNFNNKVANPNIEDYIKSVPQQGASIYGQFRNLGKHFGSGPGEGSKVDIRFGGGGKVGQYPDGGGLPNTSVVSTGGTHEQSPLGGVPMGRNALVEEDEYIWTGPEGKYVFSNRF